jgi:hypothetical protein
VTLCVSELNVVKPESVFCPDQALRLRLSLSVRFAFLTGSNVESSAISYVRLLALLLFCKRRHLPSESEIRGPRYVPWGGGGEVKSAQWSGSGQHVPQRERQVTEVSRLDDRLCRAEIEGLASSGGEPKSRFK